MLVKSITYAGLAAMVNAHIIMSQPPAYKQDGGVMNAPLHDKHAQGPPPPFPCGTKNFSGVNRSKWAAGSKQTVKFMGSAVHGGGSCQFSVTKDKNPTEKSVWKVIKSIEGGCPARNQPGNLPANSPTFAIPEGYEVEIPKLPGGEYTFAWSWFNKVGNREMYMNCAPIEITGGGDVKLDSLPDMMIANIPQTQCGTTEGGDLQFPNPGKNVVKESKGPFLPPTGSCGKAVTNNPTTPNNPPKQDPPKQDPPKQDPPKQNPPPSSGGACTEGDWNCVDGNSYKRCAGGAWSVAMPVAAGTKCKVGVSGTLNLM